MSQVKIQWASILVRAVASRLGATLPAKVWHQFNGDWVNLLGRVARENNALLVNDLDHLYRFIHGRADLPVHYQHAVVKYAFLTAYAPRALDVNAFFQVKIDRMRRSWGVLEFLNWFCGFVVQPVDLHMVERLSSPASSAPSPAVVPSDDKEKRKKLKLMRAEAIDRPSVKGRVARYW